MPAAAGKGGAATPGSADAVVAGADAETVADFRAAVLCAENHQYPPTPRARIAEAATAIIQVLLEPDFCSLESSELDPNIGLPRTASEAIWLDDRSSFLFSIDDEVAEAEFLLGLLELPDVP